MKKENKPSTPPYSQHYRCTKELFGDYRKAGVFEFLFDEFLKRQRQGKDSRFYCSDREISKATCIDRRSVWPTAKELQKIGVIELDEDAYVMNASYFMSVIRIFSASSGNQRDQIKTAFLDHDIASLRSLGLVDSIDTTEEIKRIAEGGANCTTWYDMHHQEGQEDGANCTTWYDMHHQEGQEDGANCTTWYDMHHLAQFVNESIDVARQPIDATRYETLDLKIDETLNLLGARQLDNFDAMPDDQKETLIKTFIELGINVFLEMVQFVPGGGAIRTRGWCNSYQGVVQYAPQKININNINKGTQHNQEGLEGNNCIEGFRCNSSLDRLVESINRLEKTLSVAKCFSVGGQNKTAPNFSEAGEESTEDFQLEQQNEADPWNEDEETSSFDSTEDEESDSEEIVEEDEENSQLEKPERDSGFSAWKVDPLNIAPKDDEDENPRRNHVSSTPKADEIYRKQKEERKRLEAFQNMFKNKPYFKPWEVDEILADVESCKSSPVKYFINILWYDLEAIWKEDCETKRLPADDEEPGKTIPMGDVVNSMERYYFDRKTVEDAVERAWKTMTKEVGVGYVMTNNGKLELGMRKEDIPDNINVMGIVDWELINDGKGYLVDSRRFRNIEAEDSVEVKIPRTRAEYAAERKRNRGFCKLVSSMDDSQLTPMEIAVKNFMNTYVNTDGECYFLTGGFNVGANPHSPIIPGYTMQTIVLRLCHDKEGRLVIDTDDFYKVIAMNKPKKLTKGMTLSDCDFDYCSFDAVQRWNQTNGFQSNVREEDFKLASLTQDLEAV